MKRKWLSAMYLRSRNLDMLYSILEVNLPARTDELIVQQLHLSRAKVGEACLGLGEGLVRQADRAGILIDRDYLGTWLVGTTLRTGVTLSLSLARLGSK